MAVITLDTIVNFGKYKGQPFAVLMMDTDYVNWIMSQTGFVEKFPDIVNALKHGTTPTEQSCTPEHNRLQMLFMRPEYQEGLYNLVCPPSPVHHYSLHSEKIYKAKEVRDKWLAQVEHEEKELKLTLRDRKNYNPSSNSYLNRQVSDKEIEDCQARVEEAKSKSLLAEEHVVSLISCNGEIGRKVVSKVMFEKGNWDVMSTLCSHHTCSSCDGKLGSTSFYACIELKPTISEDYPAILRKVSQRAVSDEYGNHGYGNRIVIAKEFTATSATLQEVKQMFAQSGVKFFLLSEVQSAANILPDWLTPMKEEQS